MTTRQEKIREGVAREYFAATDVQYREGDGNHSIFVDRILAYLDSQGVVIKVERELPEYIGGNDIGTKLTIYLAQEVQQDMLKWHNDSLERLIEDGH